MRQFCPFVLDADANASSSAYSCCCCSCSVTWYMLLRSSVLRCVFCCMVETQQYTDWMALRQKLHYALGLLPAKWERKKTAALIWLTTYCFKPVSLLHLWGVSVQLPRFDYSGKRSSNTFFPIVDTCFSCEDTVRQTCLMVPRWRIFGDFFASCVFIEPRAAHCRLAF